MLLPTILLFQNNSLMLLFKSNFFQRAATEIGVIREKKFDFYYFFLRFSKNLSELLSHQMKFPSKSTSEIPKFQFKYFSAREFKFKS